MATPKLRPAVLIISDTAAKDPSTDKAGDELSEAFALEGDRWDAPEMMIVPDDCQSIQHQIQQWTDHYGHVNLIVTTGGTGFAQKDRTPEAVIPLLHRQAPGLVHGMISASLEVTPFAMMSRPVAGVRHSALILTLPGSPKGAKENLQAVIKVLPHACMQAAGADSRALHAEGVKKLEQQAGISSSSGEHSGHQLRFHHHHKHHGHHEHSHGHPIPKAHTLAAERPQSNDPSVGPTMRQRSSPYPMLSVDEALRIITDKTPGPVSVEAPVDTALVGSVVSEDVFAAEAVPAYRASIVDGYALVAGPTGNAKGKFTVASVSRAQAANMPPALEDGTVARITTGAPVPENANAVVMVEDTVLVSITADGKEEEVVEILTGEIKPGENVREPGSDVAAGTKILQKGDLITAVGGEIGLLASTGTRIVNVFRTPRVGVLSTGDELVEHNDPVPLGGGQIRDSNRPSLLSCLQAWGMDVVDLGVARDKPDELEHSIRGSLRGLSGGQEGVDMLVTTGGVSMGELDLLKPTIERQLGGTIHFGRVSMKPGKPTTFATVPYKSGLPGQARESKLIFSLPGNPASALVTLNLFVLPSLHKAKGLGITRSVTSLSSPYALGLPLVTVTVGHSVPLDPKRSEYHRAIVTASKVDGRLLATSTGIGGPEAGVGQRSSRVGSLAGANALLVLEPGEGVVEKGSRVHALLMDQIIGE